MKPWLRSILFWTPRVLAILFILFLSLFALDIFGQGYTLWETLVGLTMHLLPSIGLTLALVFAWRREWVGAAAFILWAVFYLASMRGFPWQVYALIAGIPFLIGLLFLLGWIYRRQVRG